MMLPSEYNLKLLLLTVAAFNDSLKLSTIGVPTPISMAPSVGLILLTVGAVVSSSFSVVK